jgi:uncharacterized membrane protein YbhN (UPF0104 family)
VQLTQSLKDFYKRLKPILTNRWFRFSVQALILLICLGYLIVNFKNARDLLAEIQISYPVLGISWLLTLLAVFTGAIGWGFVLRTLSQHLPWVESIYTHLASNLAKYVPGYAWQLVGKAYLTKQYGISSPMIGSAMALELALLIIIGLVLAIILIPGGLLADWLNTYSLKWNIQLIRGACLIVILILSFFFVYIFRKSLLKWGNYNIEPLMLFASISVILISWLTFGISYWLLGVSFTAIPISYLPNFIFVLTSSFIIGLAIIIIPGSIGVRESIMVYLLTLMSIPSSIAVLIAVISRITLVLCELTSYFVFQIAVYKRRTFKFESEK